MSVSAWKALGRACGLSRNTAAASAAAAVRGKYGRPGKAEFVYFPKEFLFEDPKMPLLEDPESGWTIHSRRCGVIAKKLGMMPVWNKYMEHFPVTVLEIQDCQVTQVKTREKEGFYAIQVGAGERTLKHTTKPMLRHFEKAGVEPKMVTGEFRVTPDALLPVGTTFNAKHFVPGQLLDVQGVTSGKGFQGGMKRWGFGGLFATHGVSKAHRSIGSTGQCQDPGKVWKGKKMPGRMGGKKRTQKNLFLYKIDPARNLLYIRGSVPGRKGTWIRVMDAKNKQFEAPPPFPTYAVQEGESMEEVVAEMKFRSDLLNPFDDKVLKLMEERDPDNMYEERVMSKKEMSLHKLPIVPKV